MMIAWTKSILQHEGADAHRIKSFGNWTTFAIREVLVSSSWTNDDRRARCLLFRRQVRRQRRDVDWLRTDGARRTTGRRRYGASRHPDVDALPVGERASNGRGDHRLSRR